jgi:hypothetical protein
MVNSKPGEALFGLVFSKTLIIAGILFGILFAWIGNVVFTFSFPPTSADLIGIKIALFLNSLGFASICMFLLGGGISNQNIDKFVRVVMIIGGVIALVMTLVVSLSSLISLASTIPSSPW